MLKNRKLSTENKNYWHSSNGTIGIRATELLAFEQRNYWHSSNAPIPIKYYQLIT